MTLRRVQIMERCAVQGLELLRDMLTLEVPLTMNEAFCERHRRMCPASPQLEKECGKVRLPRTCCLMSKLPAQLHFCSPNI